MECRQTDHNGLQINRCQSGRGQLGILIVDFSCKDWDITTLERRVTWLSRKRSLCNQDLQRMIHPPYGRDGP